MQRQMFAKGGAAFPDMNNDGTITQADILMGRGVQFKQEGGAIDSQPSFDARDPANKARFLQQNPEMSSSDYNQIFGIEEAPSDIFDPNDPANKARFLIENEGMTSADYDKIFGVSNMAEGGIAGMMPTEMAAAPGMAGAMAAQSDMPSEAVSQAAGAMDPAVLEKMLGTVDENIQNLDGAEDFETVMNSMRGDDASIEERYAELADVVGQEDAAQTPESVLALVQPVMMLNAVDQGIGGLAQEEMTAPIEGAMAEGIMSTVAPPPQEAAPMPPAGMGGPPPVNFKDGGLVRRGDNQPVLMMQEGGDPIAQAGRLGELYQQKMPLYKSILGDPTESLQKQKELTQSQMLFDIANTALAFAAPMEGERRGMSAAERLAMAARTTQLPQTIGARAQAQLDAEKAVTAQEQQMKLSALGAAEAGLAAESKAAEALKLQQLEGAQELAKLDRKAVLDLNLQSTLEGLKQAGRIEIKNIEGAQSMSLEELKQAGAISLEDYRQVNRMALDEAQNNNKIAIEQLKASGRQSDLVLAQQLEQENIVLRGNIKLGQMGVANEYELAKMDKSHEQATELNNTNNALKENLAALDRDLAERRLSLDNLKAQVAAAQGAEKLRLQAEVNAMTAEMNEFEQGYKTDKLELERAAARLTRLGTNTNARITTLVSDPERLAKYAAGTLTPEETLEMNQAIAYYNAPKQVWNEQEKRFVLSPGNPLSNELMSSIKIRQDGGLTVPNIKLDKLPGAEKPVQTKEEITSSIMAGVEDPTAAFGTEGALKSIANTLAEVVFLGAPFKEEKSAIAGAKALNTKFIQVFQRSAELRDSVMQLNLLKDLTPTPASLLTGPEAAGEDVTRLLGMIDEAEQALRIKIDDPESPLTAKQVSEARGYLTDLAQLRAGYNVFDKAYKQGSASESKVDALRSTLGLGQR